MEEDGEEFSPSKGQKTKYPSEIILKIGLTHHQSTSLIIKARVGFLEILFIALRAEKNHSETLKEPTERQLTVILEISLTGSKEKSNGTQLRKRSLEIQKLQDGSTDQKENLLQLVKVKK